MRQRKGSVPAALSRFLIRVLVVLGLAFLAYRFLLYLQVRQFYPAGMVIAGVNVSGLSADQARQKINDTYFAPVAIYYQAEEIKIAPQDVGFALDLEGMRTEAEQKQAEQELWQGFLFYLMQWSWQPIEIPLRASHNPEQLQQLLEIIAQLMDKPARPPQLAPITLSVQEGEAGYVADVPATIEAVAMALYRPDHRQAQFVIIDQPAPPRDFNLLKQHLESLLVAYSSQTSVFILNLQTGEEIAINADIAVSGMSIVKIAILMETYRAIDTLPTFDQSKLISETAVFSGNYSANLLLDIVAGQDNAYLGVDILTESLHHLGLLNSFIATPYEERDRPERTTYITPANSRTDISFNPDTAMQTTAEEMGSLLSMIYYCSEGGGALLAAYPDQLTAQECQTLLDYMELNKIHHLIEAGAPAGTTIAHKHGWISDTHGDAGIVFSPGGDYVIVMYMYNPEWLMSTISFPLLAEISRATYNYFNPTAPFLGLPQHHDDSAIELQPGIQVK